jgi:hypothetical protein
MREIAFRAADTIYENCFPFFTRKLSRLPNQTRGVYFPCPKKRRAFAFGATAAYGENMHAPSEEILLMLLLLSAWPCALFYDRALFFY